MSPTNATAIASQDTDPSKLATESIGEMTSESLLFDKALQNTQQRIAPVWPLQDYVAVNPYSGFAAQEFLTTRQYLRTLSDLEFFMPVDYYRQQFAEGAFLRSDISAAVDELVADGVDGAERIDVNQVVKLLNEQSAPSPTADSEFSKSDNPDRVLYTTAELIDQQAGSSWCRIIDEEISKHCASHYDQGQAPWPSSTQSLSLYSAWQATQRHDRTFELMGVSGFRKLIAELPQDGRTALATLVKRLGVPQELWDDYLLCAAMRFPGWSAWTKYQESEADNADIESSDLVDLLAIRLAYEVGLSEHLDFSISWMPIAARATWHRQHLPQPTDQDLLRYALLKTSEIAFRKGLVTQLVGEPCQAIDRHRHQLFSLFNELAITRRKLAQMVFCIDVRSERIRRHFESISPEIETFGFAGFFGVPMEFVELGASRGTSNVPVLIKPQFKVHEVLKEESGEQNQKVIDRREKRRSLQKAWKEFQSTAVSAFAFVETTGLLYSAKLLARSFGLVKPAHSRYAGVPRSERCQLSPTLERLSEQGIDATKQAEIAESILRGIGIVDNFARLIVFCGHGSQAENNPLKAGLDCGACGGHSGEPNARVAAKLLNQPQVRSELAQKGIHIPKDTRFVAALHNTTTDEVQFFDTHQIPKSHLGDLEQISSFASEASQLNRNERALTLASTATNDLNRRSEDWSEVRPEWGLAGNAAFIAAPRELTEKISLDGRTFLHSYDYRKDPEYSVLEQIMTAPLVVANWINMQYYASTVDPIHFGSGNKTVHNVVGRFGVFSGNGGDLMTGLPWQSLHDGNRYQHHPLRLLAVVAAPRAAVESILNKHAHTADLVSNGWIHLLAVEDGKYYRYTERQDWESVSGSANETVRV